jgi:hypothetical protein
MPLPLRVHRFLFPIPLQPHTIIKLSVCFRRMEFAQIISAEQGEKGENGEKGERGGTGEMGELIRSLLLLTLFWSFVPSLKL